MPTIPRTLICEALSKDAEFENLLRVLEKYQKELISNPEFDVYERVDGNYVWRAESIGILRALHKVSELSEASSNEFVLMHTPSGTVILRLG
jgi:hypothetical protein